MAGPGAGAPDRAHSHATWDGILAVQVWPHEPGAAGGTPESALVTHTDAVVCRSACRQKGTCLEKV